MTFVIQPNNKFVVGFCIACKSNCDNRCNDQCLVLK